jgi:hypothetical protein
VDRRHHGALLSQAIVDVDLAGNFYAVRRNNRFSGSVLTG